MTLRRMVGGKLHRAVVTETRLDYEGSIAIDPVLYERVGFVPGEMLSIFNVNNGARFETYLIVAERDSGMVSINGAAARLVELGDKIIIVNTLLLNNAELADYEMKILLLDDKNNPKV